MTDVSNCTQCSVTQTDESKNWPEGIISVKMTMNPYLLAMAHEVAITRGIRAWELINSALWEKLGRPDPDTLMRFAANMDVYEEDPQWKKRLRITARHELEVAALRGEQQPEGAPGATEGNGDESPA